VDVSGGDLLLERIRFDQIVCLPPH
jgi:hypothetical protein